MAIFDEPEILSVNEFLETLPPTLRTSTEGLLFKAAQIIPLISNKYGSALPPPIIRVVMQDHVSAEGMEWAIHISKGLIDHCINTNPPSGICDSIDLKQLSAQTMLTWVISHEWMHVIRRHNDVLKHFGDTIAIRKALEYDADMCATAVIYRKTQEDYYHILNDLDIRNLTIALLYWPLRTLNFYNPDLEHGRISDRFCSVMIKLASLHENPTKEPDNDGSRQITLQRASSIGKAVARCEDQFMILNAENDSTLDYRSNFAEEYLSPNMDSWATWEEIRDEVGRISSTRT